MRYFIAQIVCYAGDGVNWQKLYNTDSNKSVDTIKSIIEIDMENEYLHGEHGLSNSEYLIIREYTPVIISD